MTGKLFIVIAILAMPTMSVAQDSTYAPPPAGTGQGYEDDGRAPPPAGDQTYHGQDRSYSENCGRSSGTTGMLAGAGGGGLVAGLLGASPLGIAAGVVGGGVLGRHLDKKHDEAQNEKNGC